MSLTLAAVGAIVTALLQSTVVPYVELGGARPDLLLVYTVLVSIVIGIDHGLTSAFVGGITIDALVGRPLGSTAFVLLLAAGAALLIGRALVRTQAAAVIVAVLVTALAAPLAYAVVYGALRGPVPLGELFDSLVPDLLYSTTISILAAVAAVRLHRRYFEHERIDW